MPASNTAGLQFARRVAGGVGRPLPAHRSGWTLNPTAWRSPVCGGEGKNERRSRVTIATNLQAAEKSERPRPPLILLDTRPVSATANTPCPLYHTANQPPPLYHRLAACPLRSSVDSRSEARPCSFGILSSSSRPRGDYPCLRRLGARSAHLEGVQFLQITTEYEY